MTTLNRLLRNESGATAIEYGLLSCLIAMSIMSTLYWLGRSFYLPFQNLNMTFFGANFGI